MSVGQDEQLFERFRRAGDAGALGELFDRVAPGMLRVALHLVQDPATAEDLLQSTFVRAIEVRDEWDSRRALVPWLYGLLQNRARHARWELGRSPDPARLRSPSPVDPARAAEHAEFDAAVDAAIADLPEPYRPVLRLHLAYGHAPAEIAHALERSPGTVRSQLARGLALLRKALPAGFAGLVAATLTPGRGLAAVRQAVLGHAAGAASAAVAGGLIGGAAIMKKAVVVIAVALAAVGGWFAWPRPDAQSASPPPSDQRSPPEGAAVVATTANARVAEPDPKRRTEVDREQPATTGSLRIECRWASDGSAAQGVQLRVEPGVRDGELLERTVTTGADGSVLVTDLPAGKAWVSADRGGATARPEVSAGELVTAEIEIPPGVDVRGRVVDARGTPVPAARVWLSARAHDYSRGSFVAAADRVGRFFLRSVESERFVSATSPGLRSAAVRPLRGAVGSTVDVELVLEDDAATLRGHVVDPAGLPVVGARVFVGSIEDSFRWSPEMFGGYRPPLELRTGEGGSFVADGLERGESKPLWVRAVGFCAWYQLVPLRSDAETVVEVQLQTGAALSGRVTDIDGSAVPGAFVYYRSTAWFPARGDLDDFRGPPWSHSGAVTDADGCYRIDAISPGTLRLCVRKDRLETRGEVVVAEGETGSWNPVLAEVAIRGRVVDERGEPIAGVDVTVFPPRGEGNMGTAETDAEGRFVCRTLAPVPHVLSFHMPGDKVRARPIAKLWGIEPSTEEVVVTVPDGGIPDATIVGSVLDRDGSPATRAQVRCAAAFLPFPTSVTVDAETGRFRISPLPAGTYRLQASVGSRPARRSGWGPPIVLGAAQTWDVGVIQMPETGSLVVTATGPDGEPLDGATVALEDSTGWSEQAWSAGSLAEGRLRIEGVAPAEYRVRVGDGNDLPDVYRSVRVAAGESADVAIAVPRGVAVELVLGPAHEPVPIRETFDWMRDGERLHRYVNRIEGRGEFVWKQRLLPGAYEVRVTSETGKQAVSNFVIRPDDPDGRRIAIEFP